MTRERLEKQSLESLHDIADREGIEVPDEIEISDLIDLIIEAWEEDRVERDALNDYPVSIEEKKYALCREDDPSTLSDEEFVLVCRYNESRVMLLLRDPAWAFAYWDIRDTDLKKYKLETSSSGLYLRVHELESGTFDGMHSSDYFDIPIQVTDSKWYINLPRQGIHYAIQLVFMKSTEYHVIANSNIIAVPRGTISDDWGRGDSIDPYDLLIALSGIDNLGISSYEKKIPQRIISMLDAQYLQ